MVLPLRARPSTRLKPQYAPRSSGLGNNLNAGGRRYG
jgi:hypothetical protein